MSSRMRYYFYFLKSLLKINLGLLSGMWKLTRVPQPAVTFFGGSRLSANTDAALLIAQLAEKLAHAGFSIITGGGPGVMEAANYGAAIHAQQHTKKYGTLKKAPITSIGIGVTTIDIVNPYVQDFIIQPYFFTRKWLLVRYSMAFVVGPGGFGTLDELTEVLTLIQTHTIQPMPIILIGSKYWNPLLAWIQTTILQEHLISEKDALLLYTTDSVDDAFEKITSFHDKYGKVQPEEVGITAKPKNNGKA